MPSNQESAGGGKAAKFVAANPLGPMADPFAGMVSALELQDAFMIIIIFQTNDQTPTN